MLAVNKSNFPFKRTDATADYSDEEMHAALDVNIPNYAAIESTKEIVDAISSLHDLGSSAHG